MQSHKKQWGMYFLLGSAALIPGLTYLFYSVPLAGNPVLYQKTVPVLGLLFSFLALFIGHFSYPRIHSVRAFFLGYGVGLCGMAYFCLCRPFFQVHALPAPLRGYAELLCIAGLLNCAAAAFIPATMKYRLIKNLTLGTVAVEATLLCILRFGNFPPDWLRPLLFHHISDPVLWIGPLLSAAVVLLSIWKIGSEFYLGGIVAGVAALFAAAWLCRAVEPAHAEQLRMFCMAGLSLYTAAGLAMHGFFRMEHRIAYDPLLKIYNRDYCSRIISEQASLDVAPPLAVAMVDIDHFKQVNDTYGHQAGDAVLHMVAQTVQRLAGPDGIACRYGGEELAVFFPQRNSTEAAAIAEKIRREIEKTRTRAGRRSIQVTVSAGVSHRENFDQTIVDVIQAADKALYAAKEGGRNQVKSQRTQTKSRSRG